jgi:hypothetical protein
LFEHKNNEAYKKVVKTAGAFKILQKVLYSAPRMGCSKNVNFLAHQKSKGFLIATPAEPPPCQASWRWQRWQVTSTF